MSRIMEGSGDAEWPEDEQHEGSSSSGSEVNNMDEEQQFDINLAAEHSYMGTGLVCVRGRSVLEEGWRGRVPVLAHHGAVFPGETVPLLRTDARDAALLAAVIRQDKLFGLLCPNETGTMVSGYGVLCEVFETSAGWLEEGAAPAPAQGGALVVKARATHRFRFVRMPRRDLPLHKYSRIRAEWVRVLPELAPPPPLQAARLASLDPHRRPPPPERRRSCPLLEARLRRLDAALTPWPPFVYDIFDYQRMRHAIRDYCRTIGLESEVPDDPTSLSFWAASNLALTTRDRFRLFVADNALLRLRMEVRIISRHRVLCCAECAAEISRREHIFPMSSEGVHSNYTNPGGYMHDVVTVAHVSNTVLSGRASAEYSWFPGYAWTVALCAACTTHVGWRFDATRRGLRPQRFYGLCRNTVQPRALSREPSPAPTAPTGPAPTALVPRYPSDDSDADAP